MSTVILDISRLISRVRYSTPSGVDRVEMAYVRGLMEIYDTDLQFAAVHPTGLFGLVRRDAALAYIAELEARWDRDADKRRQRPLISVLPWMARLLPVPTAQTTKRCKPIYVQASPHHLVDTGKVRRILQRLDARFLCMVHDLIPLEYPEYARPGGAALHRRRIETVAEYADAVIVNSAATGQSLQPWLARTGRAVPVHVALLGTTDMAVPASVRPNGEHPYLVCLGTIEGRKNHLLLLHIWRQFAATLPRDRIPRLVVIGKRGWENEQVLDLLDRSPTLRGLVEEMPGCPDSQLAALIVGASGLLMPSFAEGFGMPIAEALAVGVPVLCSDLPAHREVGGSTADYLDPLDGPGWSARILDYADQGEHWRAQIARIGTWKRPTWPEHFQVVQQAIEQLAERPA